MSTCGVFSRAHNNLSPPIPALIPSFGKRNTNPLPSPLCLCSRVLRPLSLAWRAQVWLVAGVVGCWVGGGRFFLGAVIVGPHVLVGVGWRSGCRRLKSGEGLMPHGGGGVTRCVWVRGGICWEVLWLATPRTNTVEQGGSIWTPRPPHSCPVPRCTKSNGTTLRPSGRTVPSDIEGGGGGGACNPPPPPQKSVKKS